MIQNFLKKKITVEKTLDINLITLDDFCKNNIQSIDILKLNVQGHEPKCLIGAKNLILNKQIKYILVELDMGDRYSVNNQFYHIEKNIVPYGYVLLINFNKKKQTT